MEELYKFMNQSNATLDLKVGSELVTEPVPEGETAEVFSILLYGMCLGYKPHLSVMSSACKHALLMIVGTAALMYIRRTSCNLVAAFAQVLLL